MHGGKTRPSERPLGKGNPAAREAFKPVDYWKISASIGRNDGYGPGPVIHHPELEAAVGQTEASALALLGPWFGLGLDLDDELRGAAKIIFGIYGIPALLRDEGDVRTAKGELGLSAEGDLDVDVTGAN